MFIVAVHYPPAAPIEKLNEFAQVFGKTAYEMRPRLSIPAGGPAVVGSYADQAQATQVEESLRHYGFQILVLSEEDANPATTQVEARSFGLAETSIWIEPRQGERIEVNPQDVALLIRGTSTSIETTTETTTTKKLSMGRAIATGGMMLRKKVEKTQQITNQQGQGILVLYAKHRPAMVMLENSLLYDSLGDAMKPSRAANFQYLTQELRRLCSHATYDDRFLRRAGQKQLLGSFLEPESHLHIATTLLAKALLPST